MTQHLGAFLRIVCSDFDSLFAKNIPLSLLFWGFVGLYCKSTTQRQSKPKTVSVGLLSSVGNIQQATGKKRFQNMIKLLEAE
jgi:hypothetical protein